MLRLVLVGVSVLACAPARPGPMLVAGPNQAIPAGEIIGLVVSDSARVPIERARVRLTALRDAERVWETRSDSAGWFVFTAIPPGTYQLTVQFIGHQIFLTEATLMGQHGLGVLCVLHKTELMIGRRRAGREAA